MTPAADTDRAIARFDLASHEDDGDGLGVYLGLVVVALLGPRVAEQS